MTPDELDRTGLIREAYRIEGIRAEECRSIFLDWAIRLPEGVEPAAAIRTMLATYGGPDHPMTQVLIDGLATPAGTGRRGGSRARRSAD
jgi:hypothetical protein